MRTGTWSFIENGSIPGSIAPYVELTRLHYFLGPTGIVWPSAWAATIISKQIELPLLEFIKLMTYMHLVGGMLSSSVGSVWNDIIDRNIDAKVERTKSRPIPSGRVTVRNALCFLLPQVSFMAAILAKTNLRAFYLGTFDLSVLVLLYPFMKRITYWPQAWLGASVSWNVFVTSAMLINDAQVSLLFPLFLGSICWIIHVDTIYGMMDRKDDIKIGMKSTALLFGKHARPILGMFSAAFVISLWITGLKIKASLGYYLFTVGLTSLHLIWQLAVVDFDSDASCARVFVSNSTVVGYLVWGGFLLEYLSV